MATDLVGNVKLQEFIAHLSDLNHQSVEAIKTGDYKVLERMNVTIEKMYAIQHNGTEEAYTAIEEDAQVIYKNMDAITTMISSCENGKIDEVTSGAVKKFLHNIFDATVRIVLAYGLA